jgi:ABC-type molybdenum transport system ATPase subunit/photorepair protein PhrA
MTLLGDLLGIRGRFTRSTRLDRDTGNPAQLQSYLPTGRSLEVVRRMAQALGNPEGTRAFSITGPYGSGKSSLAVFLAALLGHVSSQSHRAAIDLLQTWDGIAAQQLRAGRAEFGAQHTGFIPAVITAPQREPVTTTVLRALEQGARRNKSGRGIRQEIAEHLHRAESSRYATPSYHEVRRLLERLTTRKPLLLIIDEFGKNLEAYAASGREGDVYLLQELAEWASGPEGFPLVLVTIQHLAFEAYASEVTQTQRREWAKVQGRFEDVPFVDSPAATRRLIANALVHVDDEDYTAFRQRTAEAVSAEARDLGLASIADVELLAACYPLHPATLAILPELCARFGQNERTLFSFLASGEPHSLRDLAAVTELDVGGTGPWIHPDRVYDYFVDAASGFAWASADASRWIEIESIIRDAHGLSDAQRRVLKAIGVINLIAASGPLRASREFIQFAQADGQPGTATGSDVARRLAELAEAGLLVYRDFAGEYRVWRGSDFDVAHSVQAARQRVRQRSMARLLQEIQPLQPLVASRHTIQTRTTRGFARIYADHSSRLPELDQRDEVSGGQGTSPVYGCDGLLALVVGSEQELPDLRMPSNRLPVVTVVPDDAGPLIEAAVEVGALIEVSQDPDLPAEDYVARRELTERIGYARQVLDRAVAEAFGKAAVWTWHNPARQDGKPARDGRRQRIAPGHACGNLSDVLDRVFAHAPTVAYEVINRTELTSQGAKARRILLEAMLNPATRPEPFLGLTGEGPEVAMYRSLLLESGLHAPDAGLQEPTSDSWQPVWQALQHWLQEADDAPISVEHLLRQLTNPPFGLKVGTATVLLVAGLVLQASQIAVYEHGTFRPRLDAPLAERLVRNPGNFAVKYLAAGRGSRRQRVVQALAERLSHRLPGHAPAQSAAKNPTVLTVTLAVVDVLHQRSDDFTRKTRRFQRLWDDAIATETTERARAIRDALLEAHEPDILLFDLLPRAVGRSPLPASGKGKDVLTEAEVESLAEEVTHGLATIAGAQDELVGHIRDVMCAAANRKTMAEVVSLAEDVQTSEVLTPAVRRLAQLGAMADAYTDTAAWLGAVTEAVCGRSLRHWDDANLHSYLHQLRHAVADYARVADLARFGARPETPGFRAYKVSFTRDDGVSNQDGDVVTVPHAHLNGLQQALATALRAVPAELGEDEGAARRGLLALLLEDMAAHRPHAERADVEPVEWEDVDEQ